MRGPLQQTMSARKNVMCHFLYSTFVLKLFICVTCPRWKTLLEFTHCFRRPQVLSLQGQLFRQLSPQPPLGTLKVQQLSQPQWTLQYHRQQGQQEAQQQQQPRS